MFNNVREARCVLWLREPPSRSCSGFCLLFGATFCRNMRVKRVQQGAGGLCDRCNGSLKGCLVSPRWHVHTAHFAHKLQSCHLDLLFSRRWFKVEELFDTSTHGISVLSCFLLRLPRQSDATALGVGGLTSSQMVCARWRNHQGSPLVHQHPSERRIKLLLFHTCGADQSSVKAARHAAVRSRPCAKICGSWPIPKRRCCSKPNAEPGASMTLYSSARRFARSRDAMGKL